MKFDKDDPRLTAYVLDEADAAERAAIDNAMMADPELREAVDELFNAARAVADAAGTDARDNDTLHAAQALRIEARAKRLGQRRRVWVRRRFVYGSLAAAAMLLVSTLVLTGYIDRRGAAWFAPSAHWSPKSHEEAIMAAKTILSVRKAGEAPSVDTNFQQPKIVTGAAPASDQRAQGPLGSLDEFSVSPTANSASARQAGQPRPGVAPADEKGFAGGGLGGGGLGGGGFGAEHRTQGYVGGHKPISQDRQDLYALGYGGNESELLGEAPAIAQRVRVWSDRDGDGVMESVPILVVPDNTRTYELHLAQPPRAATSESYAPSFENAFVHVSQQPLSTFGLDVDTASYANVRRFLNDGQLPPPNAVRVEEFVNAFRYEYAAPADGRPVSVRGDIAGCPWNAEHRLARIAVKAKEVPFEEQPPLRLTFLIDVSGSMQDNNKLPLLRESMKALARKMRPSDQVAIATYRDTAQCALGPTSGSGVETICAAIDGLHADGSTNGAGGIEVAYATAEQQFLDGGLNRVILATDGDFNVGETENAELVRRIEEHAKSGVFLTVLGFGVDNLKDDRLEGLADKGNGNYYYIDSFAEANRVLVERMAGTIAVVAKDAKIQVEFNPAKVSAYRLLGYENRALAAQDFNDDRKDAGDLGAGHTVTALYELVPVGASIGAPGVDALKYQDPPNPVPPANDNPETMTVKLRYKAPNASESERIDVAVTDTGAQFETAPADFRFASATAAFAMLLRNSQFAGSATIDMVRQIAESTASGMAERAEFVSLVVAAKTLRGQR